MTCHSQVGQDRRGRQDGQSDDAGATLVELLVAVGIFATVLALFMAAVTTMSGVTVKAQNTADSTQAVRTAYLRMDRQVRYADAVSAPGAVGADWFVEMRSPANRSQPPACTQWRYINVTHVFQVRSWTEGTSPASTAWTTVATSVAPRDAIAGPFRRTSAGQALTRQRLAVDLRASSGSGRSTGSAVLSTAFVARNSSIASPGNADPGAAEAALCGQTATIRTTS